MRLPWSQEWFDDCKKWRGRVLEGYYRHWCFEWDELPVDETTPEFDCCLCFHCKCGKRLEIEIRAEPFARGFWNRMYWICPDFRWWNYWKHTQIVEDFH